MYVLFSYLRFDISIAVLPKIPSLLGCDTVLLGE
jgi:hypothetical protein